MVITKIAVIKWMNRNACTTLGRIELITTIFITRKEGKQDHRQETVDNACTPKRAVFIPHARACGVSERKAGMETSGNYRLPSGLRSSGTESWLRKWPRKPSMPFSRSARRDCDFWSEFKLNSSLITRIYKFTELII